jgi:hypothetical protein
MLEGDLYHRVLYTQRLERKDFILYNLYQPVLNLYYDNIFLFNAIL